MVRSLRSIPIYWVLLGLQVTGAAETDPFVKQDPPALVGRWDLTVRSGDQTYPSWLAIEQSGYRTLVGSYVGQFGSARPIAQIRWDNGSFRFAVPPQWERRTTDVVFEGTLKGDRLQGETTDEQGRTVTWEGTRAPSLKRTESPKWGTPLELWNGRDLTGWKPRSTEKPHGWIVRDGILVNATPGIDLMTEKKFSDFRLQAEFRYPQGSNSGIYLRGRYEFQIEDNYGDEPDSHKIGGVYGFLTPRVNAAKPADTWQTVELTLVGRVLTVVLNGEPVIERQAIPGITGGALDSQEASAGPILIQGDHGVVEFRKLTLIPAIN